MLPVMVASGFSGPIAGLLVSRLGLREVATGGMLLSAFSFRPGVDRFQYPAVAGLGLMTLLNLAWPARCWPPVPRLWRQRRRRKRRPRGD